MFMAWNKKLSLNQSPKPNDFGSRELLGKYPYRLWSVHITLLGLQSCLSHKNRQGYTRQEELIPYRNPENKIGRTFIPPNHIG